MNFRTTLGLLIIVIIGGGYILLFESKQKSVEDQEKASKKVVGIEDLSDKVAKVRIQAEKAKAIVCERKGEGSDAKWAMLEPRKLRADKSEVKSVLSDLEFLEKKDATEAKESELSKWGLDNPRGSITFWIDDEETTLQIGSECPDGSNVWVKLSGKAEVYKVAKSIFDKAEKSLSEMREKKLLDVEKDNVSRMELAFADGTTIECTMDKSGWALKKPVEDQGNKDEIEKLIDKLKDLDIDKDDFIVEETSDLAKYGLDKPQLTAVVYQKDVSQTILVGSKAEDKTDKLYAKRKDEPTIVAIKKSFLDDMKKEPKDLRDKKLARVEKDDVESCEIKMGDKTVAMAKKDSDWMMSKPKEMKCDTWEVEDFYSDLGKLEVDDFVEDKPGKLDKYGLDKPLAEITVKLKEDKGERTVIIGAKEKDGDKYYMRRGGQDPVLLVDAKDLVKSVNSGYLAFRKRLVLEFSKSNAKKLTVKREDKTFVCQINKDDDSKWDLLEPIKCEADKTEIDDILWDLSYLKAKVFVEEDPKDLKPYGLDKPSIEATVEFEKEVEEEEKEGEEKKDDDDKDEGEEKKKKKVMMTKVLLIGKKTDDDRYYAKVKDEDLVFETEESYVKNLKEELASKNILKVEKDDVKAVTLAYAKDSKTVKIEKDGDDKWKMTKPEEKSYDKSDVDDILDELDDFRAKSIETYAAKDLAKYGLAKPCLTITLDLGDGQKTVHIGDKKDDDLYYAKAEGKDFIFLAEKDDVEKVMKEKPEEEKKEEEPAAEEKKDEPAEAPKAEAKPEAKPEAAAKPAAAPKPEAKKEAPAEAKPAAAPKKQAPAAKPAAAAKPEVKKEAPAAKPAVEAKPEVKKEAPAAPAEKK